MIGFQLNFCSKFILLSCFTRGARGCFGWGQWGTWLSFGGSKESLNPHCPYSPKQLTLLAYAWLSVCYMCCIVRLINLKPQTSCCTMTVGIAVPALACQGKEKLHSHFQREKVSQLNACLSTSCGIVWQGKCLGGCLSIELCSGTNTEFYVPDHGSQAAIMAKFRAFMLNPDFFLTPFGNFLDFQSYAR